MHTRQAIQISLLSSATLLGGAGCGRVAPEPSSVNPVSPIAAAIAADAPGYQHAYTRSKFHTGASPHLESDGSYVRWRGQEGTFGIEQRNGSVLAVPAATSSALLLGPYSTDGATHDELVEAYFTSAGIPADQIQRVGATYQYGVTNQRGQPEPSPTLTQVTSALTRTVGGYIVVDSIAEASFNANEEVTQESVYWPAIPAAAIADAQAITATLADPIAGPAFLAALPAHEDQGRVVIRHTSAWTPNLPLVVAAAYDIHVNNTARHFDIHASEFRLPQETSTLTTTPIMP